VALLSLTTAIGVSFCMLLSPLYFFISLFLYFFISLFLYFFISLFLYFFISLFVAR